jgi:uncharacterized membrane protein
VVAAILVAAVRRAIGKGAGIVMKQQTLIQTFKRLVKHSGYSARDAKRAVPASAQAKLQEKIHQSELRHSGQIRLCIEAALPIGHIWQGLPLRDRAIGLFEKLGVGNTEHHNGVLIYLQLAEQKIEIVTDHGLNLHASSDVWTQTMMRMRSAFQAGHFERGLNLAIDEVTDLLVQHFPDSKAHTNELPDAPVVQ